MTEVEPRLRVLLVDDDEAYLASLKAHLDATSRFDVSTASRSAEVLSHVSDRRPDLIISEIDMPGLEGRVLATTLRESGIGQGIGLIFLTSAIPGTADKQGWGRVAGWPIVSKQAPLEELLALITPSLPPAPSHPPAHLPIPAGARVGRYEIKGVLGAGGMGEVYRAYDADLKREVAIKVLLNRAVTDEASLRRLEAEARAAAALNHPNILAVYDVGAHEGSPFIVSELLEGETLRQAMARGPLPLRKILDYATQIAEGLAAAHAKGVVHRDLKPANLWLARDGRVKILDFGLARILPGSPRGEDADWRAAQTVTVENGLYGTAGYMAPEQVRGEKADPRSDLFAFGVVLHEMASGRRLFSRNTPVESLNAILRDDPPPLTAPKGAVPQGLERIVFRCLEKEPSQRFQSALDLAFALEAVGTLSGDQNLRPMAPEGRGSRVSRTSVVIAGALLLAGIAVAFLLSRNPEEELAAFRQLTFRRGSVISARFAPDGRTVVYSAAWEGEPPEIFTTIVGSPESRPLGFKDAMLLDVSSSGEIALSEGGRKTSGRGRRPGTLAVAPLAGGAPRKVREGILWAEWTANGKQLAVVQRDDQGGERLEFPLGKEVYRTSGEIVQPAISPRGDEVAFIEYRGTTAEIVVVDTTGRKHVLAGDLVWVMGLVWDKARNLLFAASNGDGSYSIRSVDLDGKSRTLHRLPGYLTLHDVSPSGQLLVTVEDWRVEALARLAGESSERSLSWFDVSNVRGLSADGRTAVLFDLGSTARPQGTIYIRGTDGSPAVRLGTGVPLSLSPDGKWLAVSKSAEPSAQIEILPTGAGEPRTLDLGSGRSVYSAAWFPDGRRLLIGGGPGANSRCHVYDLSDGSTRPVGPDGLACDVPDNSVSADGRRFLARAAESGYHAYAFDGTPPAPLRGLLKGEIPVGWGMDNATVFVQQVDRHVARVDVLDIMTGRRRTLGVFSPADRAGVNGVSEIFVTPDTRAYAYSYLRFLSTLYLLDEVP